MPGLRTRNRSGERANRSGNLHFPEATGRARRASMHSGATSRGGAQANLFLVVQGRSVPDRACRRDCLQRQRVHRGRADMPVRVVERVLQRSPPWPGPGPCPAGARRWRGRTTPGRRAAPAWMRRPRRNPAAARNPAPAATRKGKSSAACASCAWPSASRT